MPLRRGCRGGCAGGKAEAAFLAEAWPGPQCAGPGGSSAKPGLDLLSLGGPASLRARPSVLYFTAVTDAQGGKWIYPMTHGLPNQSPTFVPLQHMAATHNPGDGWNSPGAQQLSPACGWRKGRPHCSGLCQAPPGEWPGCERK